MSRGLTVLLLPALSGGVALGIFLADVGGGGLIPAELMGFGALLITAWLTRAAPKRRTGVPLVSGLSALVVLGVMVGTFRESQAGLSTGPGTITALAGAKDEFVIRATVLDDPRPREDRQQVVLERVEAGGRPVPGRILAWIPRAIELATGDRVLFRARLEEPQDIDGFAYRAFLARQGIGAIARTFDATVVSHQALGLAAGAAQ